MNELILHCRKTLSVLFCGAMVFSGCKKEDFTPNHNFVTGVKRVWAVDDGEKIKQEDINNPLANDVNNLVWKDSAIHIFGGRNEIVAFQLIIQAEPGGANQVNVTISDLDNGGAVIPGSGTGSSDPYDYTGRYIELFSEHYLNIESRTPPLWFYSNSAMPSSYYLGWVPDCLIPFSAPPGKGGAPFSIGGNKNQGVWVDILIPRDASAGTYEGEATITVSDKIFRKIPISLEVYEFILPDSTHMYNMFGYDPWYIAPRHGLQQGSSAYYDLEVKYFQMAHRHRFDLVTSVSGLEKMDKYYKRYYTGEIYNASYGYAGPGENVGNTTFSIGYGGSLPVEYGTSINTVTQSGWWAGSDMWEEWFLENAPGVAHHKYLFPDEPDWKGPAGALGTGSMDTIKMQANWTHSNPGIGRNIPCLVTNKIKPVIQGYVDFWSVSSQDATLYNTLEEVESEKELGHQYGIYNGYRPGMGAVIIDGDAVEFRVMPWIVWKYDLDQYFYWSSTYWTNLNVFKTPLTYWGQVNGDGTFLYPGQDYIYPNESRDLEGPLSSVRAKNWRRGAQDYEYLWLARQAGLETEARAIVDNCVPAALWDAKYRSNISWSSRGYVFEQCRKNLAELISQH